MKTIFTNLWNYTELRKKYNTLKNDYDILEELVKEETFEKVLSNANTEIENARLKEENKNLRKKIKVLKEIIKNGE